MKRILLIAPDFHSEYFSKDFDITGILSLEKKAIMVPLQLATIAALTPDDIEVDLWDEPIHGLINGSTDFKKDYDLVGITSFGAHIPRAREIARIFRQRSIPVAVGGSGVSATPERYRDFFDVLFIGEAELTWPQFISDWKAGKHHSEYRQVDKPGLDLSPLPRWDAIAEQMRSYLLGAVQTTRGCPFDCEFCDVVALFGHRLRHKKIERVLKEVRNLERLGIKRIFFCDDNFIGSPKYAKELLRELIPLNNSFQKPLHFQTQLSINVAKDEELLAMLADANFGQIAIGIESTNKESLKETNKLQNYRANLIEDCKKIQSYGMPIRAEMIVGFDHDDASIFDEQLYFLQEACLPVPSIHILHAPVGTKLWTRLRNEGCLLVDDGTLFSGSMRASTNIIPKQMTRVELMEGFLGLLERTRDWNNFAARVKGFVSGFTRQPNVSQNTTTDIVNAQKMVKQFLLSVDESTRRTIFDIIMHIRSHAPFLFERVFRLIIQQYSEIALLQSLREEILERIELEKSGKVKLETY